VGPARAWNLLSYEPQRPEVTAPASRRGAPGIRLHRSHSLDAQDTTNHHGVPITTLARTLLDIAAQIPEHHLERALAQAERLQLYDHRAIEAVIARANGHRGTRTLSTAIADDPQFTRGELEALNKLARDHGLRQPECNTTVLAHESTSCVSSWGRHATFRQHGPAKSLAPAPPAVTFPPSVSCSRPRACSGERRPAARTQARRGYAAPSASRNSASSDSSIE
jgi:hypothetical protein